MLGSAFKKWWKYVKPTYENSWRSVGAFCSIIVVPAISVAVPFIFLQRHDEDNESPDASPHTHILTLALGASTIALISGIQKALVVTIGTSVMQEIRKENIDKLMNDESKVLMYHTLSGDDIKTPKPIQYMTVGRGVSDFSLNTTGFFTNLPMYSASALSTLVQIYVVSDSKKVVGSVVGFAFGTAFAAYAAQLIYSVIQAKNQLAENNLVAGVEFIDANGSAISIMHASSMEKETLDDISKQVNKTFSKIFFLSLAYNAFNTLTPAIAAQFLGTYYTEEDIDEISQTDLDILNVMIMTLVANVQNIVTTLTNTYSNVKLNTPYLDAFDRACESAQRIRTEHNKMTVTYGGYKVILSDFSCSRSDHNNGQILIINNTSMELQTNKIYHLSAPSGTGKTTFLKSLTDSGQYTNGHVTLPEYAKENIHFVPQRPFIASGSLLSILTYPQKFVLPPEITVSETTGLIEANELTEQQRACNDFIKKVMVLLGQAGLLATAHSPNGIKRSELTTIKENELPWKEKLSGGEKQKIGIIRAILSGAQFIIMDEAASALDPSNKKLMYDMMKAYLGTLDNYTLIYTDHYDQGGFSNIKLNIAGNGELVYEE